MFHKRQASSTAEDCSRIHLIFHRGWESRWTLMSLVMIAAALCTLWLARDFHRQFGRLHTYYSTYGSFHERAREIAPHRQISELSPGYYYRRSHMAWWFVLVIWLISAVFWLVSKKRCFFWSCALILLVWLYTADFVLVKY